MHSSTYSRELEMGSGISLQHRGPAGALLERHLAKMTAEAIHRYNDATAVLGFSIPRSKLAATTTKSPGVSALLYPSRTVKLSRKHPLSQPTVWRTPFIYIVRRQGHAGHKRLARSGTRQWDSKGGCRLCLRRGQASVGAATPAWIHGPSKVKGPRRRDV